jgi:hypothetical protein
LTIAIHRRARPDLTRSTDADSLSGTNAFEQPDQRVLSALRGLRVGILEHVLQDLHVGLRDIGL